MRAAGDRNEALGRGRACFDFTDVTDGDCLFKRRVVTAPEHAVNGGCKYDTSCGLAVFDQGNVDGEFAVVAQELFCSIQGVDEKKRPGADIGQSACGGALFGDDGYRGFQFAQVAKNQFLCCFVGGCDGRIVRFLAGGGVCGVMLHDHAAGFARDIDEVRQQGAPRGDCESSLWIHRFKRFLSGVWLVSLMLSPLEQTSPVDPMTNPGGQDKSQDKMHELDLAALLVSRVCHDLISPVAAISNGLEILADEQDPVMRAHAMRLIEHSVGQAKARLLFARLAFGAMGSAGAEVDLYEVGQVATEFFKTGKARLDWQMPAIAIDKEIVRVVLNLAALGADCIPRGGSLVVKAEQARAIFHVAITAKGLKANLAPDIREGLAMQIPSEDLTGRTIAPFITALLAKKINGDISYSIVDDTIRFDARFERKAV